MAATKIEDVKARIRKLNADIQIRKDRITSLKEATPITEKSVDEVLKEIIGENVEEVKHTKGPQKRAFRDVGTVTVTKEDHVYEKSCQTDQELAIALEEKLKKEVAEAEAKAKAAEQEDKENQVQQNIQETDDTGDAEAEKEDKGPNELSCEDDI